METYLIIQATAADTGTICAIAEATWWPTYSPILEKEQIRFMLDEIYSAEQINKQLLSGEQSFLLLLEAGEAVAFAAYSLRHGVPDTYKLHKLYCLPKTQGKGYGKVLINAVIEIMLQDGRHILELNVNRNNKARYFYEKMGFEVIYEEDIAIGPYWMNDYVMRKEL